MSLKTSPIWEGVFNSFSEAGGDLDAFDSDTWLKKQQEKIKRRLKYGSDDQFCPQEYPLSLAISMLSSPQNKLAVLDIGGGMGEQYLELISKNPFAKNRVDYYIVDGKSSIEGRPTELNVFNNLYFYSDMDEIKTKIDVVHMGSTLQYIENWEEFLKNVSYKFNPQFIVFSDVLTGNIPTFVTHQKFYNKKIPIRMLNIDEFKKKLKHLFYNVIYETNFQSPFLGNLKFALSEIPEKYRISCAKNMIFMRDIP